MPRNHEFAREDKFPSWFANRIQDFLAGTETRLQLVAKSATVIEIAPDPHLGAAAVLIEGRWRFITSAIERAMSGAKGTYTIWAVAEDNLINNTPDPFTDHTAYAFDLRFTTGAAPTGSGIAISTKIGEVDWSGTAIEALRQTHASVTGAQLTDGAFSNAGDLAWKREPGGAMVPTIVDGAVSSRKLKPTVGIVTASAAVGLNEAFKNVTGGLLEITPAVPSILKVTTVFEFAIASTATQTRAQCVGTLKVDTAAELGPAAIFEQSWFGAKEEVFAVTCSQVYNIPLTAAKHSIQMRARAIALVGAPTVECSATHTQMQYEMVAS